MARIPHWRPEISQVAIGLLGLAAGAWFASGQSRLIVAGPVAAQTADGAALVTGPVSVQYNERTKVQANQDALYFLDYRAGKLYATLPAQRSTVNSSTLIDTFVERDLVADFKLDLNQGAAPQFLMSSGALGAFGEGCSPLFVFETTSRQVAIYKYTMQSVGSVSRPRFDLMEVKSIVANTKPAATLPAGFGAAQPPLPR